jgi:hypothetical protein
MAVVNNSRDGENSTMAVLVIGEMQGGNAATDQRLMQELGLQNRTRSWSHRPLRRAD